MIRLLSKFTLCLIVTCVAASVAAEPRVDHFRQLDDVWPTPNDIRRPSGAPGKDYWQQKVDYVIDVAIDDERQILTGSETITYHNNSPDELPVLWIQLDQNRYELDSDDWLSTTSPDLKQLSYDGLRTILYRQQFDSGFKITKVVNEKGKPLDHSIVRTMMRVHLPKPLKPGKATTFSIDWLFEIPDGKAMKVRGGLEFFEKDGNYIYNIAQWYSTDHVDVSIEQVRHFRLDSRNPEVEKQREREERASATPSLTEQRNNDTPKRVDQSAELNDFYTDFDDLTVLPSEQKSYRTLLEGLKPEERELLQTEGNFYVVDIKNLGGVVMPLVLEIKFTDDSQQTVRMPAAVWRLNGNQISKLLFTQKEIASITVDPVDEMADGDRHNNRFPRLPIEESFQLQKPKKTKNAMQQLKQPEATEAE